MPYIDEEKVGSEIMRLAGGRIVLACLASAAIGFLVHALLF